MLQLLLLLFLVDRQQTDEPLLHLFVVVELKGREEGRVVLEGEVTDKKDYLEVGRERSGYAREGGHGGE
jgi:hypothetical protein